MAVSAKGNAPVEPAEHEQPRAAGAVLPGVECSGGLGAGADPAHRMAVRHVPVSHAPPAPQAEYASS
jgi:hypothetical protein